MKGHHHTFAPWAPASTGVRFFGEAHWREPRGWNADAYRGARREVVRVLVDVFEDRPDLVAQRMNLWLLIRDTPHLDWQVVTDHTTNVRRLLSQEWRERLAANVAIEVRG